MKKKVEMSFADQLICKLLVRWGIERAGRVVEAAFKGQHIAKVRSDKGKKKGEKEL